MLKNKIREQRIAIIRGFITLIIGLIIGGTYFKKSFPFNPITNTTFLTVWAYTGLIFAALAILYGLCEIFIKGGRPKIGTRKQKFQ